jgi:protein-disulfide isomerase
MTDVFSIKKQTLWQAATVLFGILVVLAIFTDWFVMGEKAAPVEGKKAAGGTDKVVIEEYSDFQCPFCGKFFKETLPKIKEAYGGKVEFVFKHFPLDFHEYAQKAAEASECARDQGKFWGYHDMLFENQQALDTASLKKYAKDLGLDTKAFNDCLDKGDKTAVVQQDYAEGQQRGVSGTPAFFINGEKITGAQPFPAFQAAIDRALSGESAPSPTPSAAQPSPPAAKVEASADDDPAKGKRDAPVTIIEWSDFQCPFCAKFFTQTLPQIEKEYIATGKAKLVYRDFPLSFHQYAQKAAEAAECADDQGKFWEMHDMIFENQDAISVDDLKGYAEELGLDTEAFNDCLDSSKYEGEVQKDMADGQAAGVSGTPGFVINGRLIVGAQPFSSFKQAIDAALAEAE